MCFKKRRVKTKAASTTRPIKRLPFEPEMILVPAGEFSMGDELQRVYLPDYYIARTPITNAQYDHFIRASNRNFPDHWKHNQIPAGKEHHPVVDIYWYDTVAYCVWLSKATQKPYRLPTEAEWEKAARGTNGRQYPWGNEPPNENLCNFNGNVGDTTPVGKYSPQGDSPYGVADMAGNVWEWTSSLYRNYPYDPADGREELETRQAVDRVVRGGAFNTSADAVRCVVRDGVVDIGRFTSGGFRVVLVPS